MKYPVYLYIAVMAIVTYLIRMLPLTLIKKEIKNPFIRSFLYYVPYVTLSVMTFPAIIYATASPVSGAAALAVALFFAYKGKSLFQVSIAACAITSEDAHINTQTYSSNLKSWRKPSRRTTRSARSGTVPSVR